MKERKSLFSSDYAWLASFQVVAQQESFFVLQRLYKWNSYNSRLNKKLKLFFFSAYLSSPSEIVLKSEEKTC